MIEEIQVSGLADVVDELKRLPEKLQGKAMQGALTKAAKPIVKTARQLAPVQSGTLRRAIYSYRDRDSTKTYEARLISVKNGKRAQKSNRDAYYWKFIEFGRGEVIAGSGKVLAIRGAKYTDIATRQTRQNVTFAKYVRAAPPRPFMRPAFEQNKYKALQIVQDEMKGVVDKVAKKAQARSVSRLARALRRTTIGI